MCCEEVRKYKKLLLKGYAKAEQLYRRDLPTKYHKEAWKQFEKVLMYRTNSSWIIRIL